MGQSLLTSAATSPVALDNSFSSQCAFRLANPSPVGTGEGGSAAAVPGEGSVAENKFCGTGGSVSAVPGEGRWENTNFYGEGQGEVSP